MAQYSGLKAATRNYYKSMSAMDDTQGIIEKMQAKFKRDDEIKKVRDLAFMEAMKLGQFVAGKLDRYSNIKKGMEQLGLEGDAPNPLQVLLGIGMDKDVGFGITAKEAGLLGASDRPEYAEQLLKVLEEKRDKGVQKSLLYDVPMNLR